MQLTNFYENVEEARMRLRGTIVLYDKEPYYVSAITNHKGDGVFRIYLEEIGWDEETPRIYPPALDNFPAAYDGLGPAIDDWLETEKGKKSGVLRKKMNSPLFNKFRPFPLGMCNVGIRTFYVERQPTRKSEQGLVRSMLLTQQISTVFGDRNRQKTLGGYDIEVFSKDFKRCIKGEYPSAEECLLNLNDPAVENEAAAFHRQFALVRGPLDMIFLGYKGDIIGVLPKNNFDVVKLGSTFGHCKEVVESLNLFTIIM